MKLKKIGYIKQEGRRKVETHKMIWLESVRNV